MISAILNRLTLGICWVSLRLLKTQRQIQNNNQTPFLANNSLRQSEIHISFLLITNRYLHKYIYIYCHVEELHPFANFKMHTRRIL